MATLVMNTIVNPFRGFGRGFYNFCEVLGYSRAASELARMGLYEEARNCMMQIKKIKSSK
jgi:hypothetical protein